MSKQYRLMIPFCLSKHGRVPGLLHLVLFSFLLLLMITAVLGDNNICLSFMMRLQSWGVAASPPPGTFSHSTQGFALCPLLPTVP